MVLDKYEIGKIVDARKCAKSKGVAKYKFVTTSIGFLNQTKLIDISTKTGMMYNCKKLCNLSGKELFYTFSEN